MTKGDRPAETPEPSAVDLGDSPAGETSGPRAGDTGTPCWSPTYTPHDLPAAVSVQRTHSQTGVAPDAAFEHLHLAEGS